MVNFRQGCLMGWIGCVVICSIAGFAAATADAASGEWLVDGRMESADDVVFSEDPVIEATGDTRWLNGGDRAVDIVGGMENSSSGSLKAKGNAYRVDMDTTLEMAEFYLNYTGEMLLQYYVYESTVEFGTYNRVWTDSGTVTGTGGDWYSSGPINVDLGAGKYYIIAVSWDGTCTYYYNVGDSQATSFGAHVYGYATGSHPLPASFVTSSNDQAIYYQRITTGTGMPTPTPTVEPTVTPSPTATEEPCINDGDVTLDGEITAGDAQLAFLIALGSYTPTFEEACAADCNGDEEITAGDAQQIFLTALGSAACVDPL